MMEKPRKKPGRKPVVIDIDRVEQLAAQGLGPYQISRSSGISWDTYKKNKKRSLDVNTLGGGGNTNKRNGNV